METNLPFYKTAIPPIKSCPRFDLIGFSFVRLQPGGVNMKKIILLLIIFLLVMMISVSILHDNEKTLSETLTVQPEKVDKIMISSQEEIGQYKITTNPEQINRLIDYLNQVTYTRLSGDHTSYMPMKATIIYLYEQDKQDFIVPYETEAMINHNVYKINHGKIQNAFLIDYYQSLN